MKLAVNEKDGGELKRIKQEWPECTVSYLANPIRPKQVFFFYKLTPLLYCTVNLCSP